MASSFDSNAPANKPESVDKESATSPPVLPDETLPTSGNELRERATGDSNEQVVDRFHSATGLDRFPDQGTAAFRAKAVEMEVHRGQGVSPAQVVSFWRASGETLNGLMYTKSDGTFFKTTAGESYRIKPNDAGGFDLIDEGLQVKILQGANLKVLPNAFSIPASIKPEPIKLDQAKADLVKPQPVKPEPVKLEPLKPEPVKLEPVKPEPMKLPERSEVPPPIPRTEEPSPKLIQQPGISAEEENSVVEDVKEEPKEDAEEIKARIQQREQNRRRRYLVKEKDTLQSIALKHFRDVRAADLIFEINKHLIPVRIVRGRQIREPKPRSVIFLPTAQEVSEFRDKVSEGPK